MTDPNQRAGHTRTWATTPLRAALIAAASVWLAASSVPASVIVANNSFEANPVSVTGYGSYYTPGFGSLPAVTGWSFGASGGQSYDGLFLHNPPGAATNITTPPDGEQAAFVEGTGSFTNSLSGFMGGGRLSTVSFWAETPNFANWFGNPTQVRIDGVALTFNNGASNTVKSANGVWNFYTSDPFTVSAGAHTLAFVGTLPYLGGGVGQDPTSAFDLITVNEVPEPSTFVLLALGAALAVRQVRRPRV